MRYMKTILCLANSRKPPSGFCVAGREITSSGFGGWIRPISARPTAELSVSERQYEDGSDPKVLDVISIELCRRQSHLHQQENHCIDVGYFWLKRGRVDWQKLQAAVEDPGPTLWLNGCSSSHGLNDRVPEAMLGRFSRSLYLVRPQELTIIVASEDAEFGLRRRVRTRFKLNGNYYQIPMTDPVIERMFMRGKDGEISLPEAALCLSLGEVYHGYSYKLAASVITPLRAGL
jgi:hypothetical protein